MLHSMQARHARRVERRISTKNSGNQCVNIEDSIEIRNFSIDMNFASLLRPALDCDENTTAHIDRKLQAPLLEVLSLG